MTNYEMTEKLSEKMGVTMEAAKTALEACDWDMLDAALLLEKERGEEKAAYSTRQAEAEPAENASRHMDGRALIRKLGNLIRKLVACGNRNRLEVRKNNALVMEIPVTAVALLLIFAFWVCIPLLVIGLFAGFRYSFIGEELGRESINQAMDKAAEAADRVKEELHVSD